MPLSRFEWLSAIDERHVCEFSCTCISTRHNNLYANYQLSLSGTTVQRHSKVFLAFGHPASCDLRPAICDTMVFELVVLWNFSIFDFDFTKIQHYHLDCQQLNTTTNHIHPKSFTLESVTWTYMYMLWDTTVKKKSEILKCHQYLGFLFFFLWIYMWRQQYIIIYILIHNRV